MTDHKRENREWEHHEQCQWKQNGICTSGCPIEEVWTYHFAAQFETLLGEARADFAKEVMERVETKMNKLGTFDVARSHYREVIADIAHIIGIKDEA